METQKGQNTNESGNAKMAFPIDLNEAPISSPREVADDAVLGSSSVYVCSVCRKGVPAGRRAESATEEQRKLFKCFGCLLKNDGGSGATSSSSRASGEGGVGRFDINASPPREADGDAVVVGRGGNGGGKIQALATQSSFSGHHSTTRQLNPMLEGIGYNPRVDAEAAHSGFQDMFLNKLHSDGSAVRKQSVLESGHAGASRYLPETPNMAYLETLREYISERSGDLREGWRVEFEFCNERYKTSAVYISPDGSRHRSMEDVANHLGLPLSHSCLENERGIGGFAFNQSGLPVYSSKKGSSALRINQYSRQKQSLLRGSSGIIRSHELSSNRDGIDDCLPIQFQDFCLISAGNVDLRPAYHSTNQIWPVGYRCSWHDRITGSLFVCVVSDGGDCGPSFKVQRYPCALQSIPTASTILSRANLGFCKGDDRLAKDNSATAFSAVDDDSISVITLLNEDSPPCLEDFVSTSNREDNSSNSEIECLPPRSSSDSRSDVKLNDMIEEFQVEGRSTSSVWEMVSQAFVYACRETFKQKGGIRFFCEHNVQRTNNEYLHVGDPLLRYCCFGGPVGIPPLVKNENELNMVCEMVSAWLNQDRFGLDLDFVQEILERLPGVSACSEYRNLNDQKSKGGLRTVGSGFFQAERKTNNSFGTSNKSQWQLGDAEDILKRDPCPLGKPLGSRLPSYLLGDALQVWELAWRFCGVLGFRQPCSFQELESELLSPWLDGYPPDSRHETEDTASGGRSTGLLLGEILGSLLKLLVTELLSKVAVYVCPNFDAGESKSRRGRKKDLDYLAAFKKTKLDMLPINELTWHEIARRYILAVLSMDGNLDSSEIASRESGKVFHCLRGDGGILCGSLTGIAALEEDAVVLADAVKEIYGKLKGKNEIISIGERESDVECPQTIEENDGGTMPEWAQVLEPVRKLPTNVGARIRRCINEALEKNPPEWAKRILVHSISKEVYKGNASGPTKRAVISVLTDVSKEIPQQKVEKKEKVRIKTNLSDLISKQCRVVLRRAAAADEERAFCNLLGRTILKPNDNADEGLLGYPAMVSRPLDFRTIDLRLAAGVYGGSHEDFVDDVREVWRNIRTAYHDQPDLIDAANKLSEKFEDLYKKEVLSLVDKISEFSNVNGSNTEATRERDDLLVEISKSSIPKAPWEEGLCKVCGMDKDDDNVLLCDSCDSEYHRYCLNPPLLKIPDGNWYCPSCVAGKSISFGAAHGSVVNQFKKRRNQGEFTRKFLETLARLSDLMEKKEFWDFTIEERLFFMKFLFDEALNSATIHDHMDQCASQTADLQQRLRSLTSELKIMKFKEEMMALNAERANSGVYNGRVDLKSDASSSALTSDNNSRAKTSEKGSHLSFVPSFPQFEDAGPYPYSNEQSDYNRQSYRPPSRSNNSTSVLPMWDRWQNELPGRVQQPKNDQTNPGVPRDLQVMAVHNLSGPAIDLAGEHASPAPVSSMHESRGPHGSDPADVISSQDNSLKMSTVRNNIRDMEDSIANIESELLKVSLRKDFLGRDCNGRVYWAFYCRGARPWIVANGSSTSKKRGLEEFVSVPDSEKWISYESDDEIGNLVGWLRENNTRERELKESILQLQSNKSKDSGYTEKHILSKGESKNHSIFSGEKKALPSCFPETKASTVLEKRFGPCIGPDAASGSSRDGKTRRCECLELLWPSKGHCSSCHQSFPNSEELKKHLSEKCKPVVPTSNKRSLPSEDLSKRKKPRNVVSREKPRINTSVIQTSTSEKPNEGFKFIEPKQKTDCPFKFEEIMARFIVPGSVKDAVNEIGLIGSGGVPSFVPNKFTHLSDPALALGPTRMGQSLLPNTDLPAHSRNQQQKLSNEASAVDSTKGGKELSRSEGERVKSSMMGEKDQELLPKDKSFLLGSVKSNIIRESSSRPLVGRALAILRFLKIHLLDMDDALPEDALRASRAQHDRRCVWRAFLKSARSIYEMVQAIIILEDTIKSEYLRSDWWYWSSPSTAAKITTLSALALRIYALDSAISYEKPLPNAPTEIFSEPNPSVNEVSPSDTSPKGHASPQTQKTPESSPVENPRTRRMSKRKKDLNS